MKFLIVFAAVLALAAARPSLFAPVAYVAPYASFTRIAPAVQYSSYSFAQPEAPQEGEAEQGEEDPAEAEAGVEIPQPVLPVPAVYPYPYPASAYLAYSAYPYYPAAYTYAI